MMAAGGSRVEILAALREIRVPLAASWSAPAATPSNDAQRLALFAERLTDYGATISSSSGDALAGAVAVALAGADRVVMPRGLAEEVAVHSKDLMLDDPTYPLTQAAIETADAVVTASCCAVALSGSIALQHGPSEGRRVLTLLPDYHVCIVEASAIVDDLPAALRRLDPLRPVTFISGPSATSDIEMTRIQGVHGPRRLHVIVVDAESSGHSELVGS